MSQDLPTRRVYTITFESDDPKVQELLDEFRQTDQKDQFTLALVYNRLLRLVDTTMIRCRVHTIALDPEMGIHLPLGHDSLIKSRPLDTPRLDRMFPFNGLSYPIRQPRLLDTASLQKQFPFHPPSIEDLIATLLVDIGLALGGTNARERAHLSDALLAIYKREGLSKSNLTQLIEELKTQTDDVASTLSEKLQNLLDEAGEHIFAGTTNIQLAQMYPGHTLVMGQTGGPKADHFLTPAERTESPTEDLSEND